ncbi:MAG TPA: sulfatase-like hydrolase/transferase [Candidatus Polarisedimenticolaceae bacterium]|nr:sulfatase-like hydrolase/transferase [Candidatus Polarisedimenticolaceae bacterium]
MAATAAPDSAPPPPSVLLVTIDTLRADHVGAYGRRPSPTPNLDRLAASGVRFDEARTLVPLTLPAHASLLTAMLPPRHGLRANGLGRLKEGVTTLAEVLRARGYRTAAVVASVVLDRAHGLDRGFDVYDDNQRVGDRAAFGYAERGASQIASSAQAALGKLQGPFFLWVHLYDPHRPWVAPARFPGGGYDAEIAFADEALETVRRAADTRAGGRLVVAVAGDHGESLGEQGEDQHGYTIHRGVMRVPLVLAGVGIPRGRTVPRTVALLDLAPTLADLAGTRFPQATDGVSLRAAWEGKAAAAPLELWQETLHPLFDAGWAPLRGLLTDRWNFVDAPRPRLYDRARDPGDKVNVAGAHPEDVAALKRRMAQRMAALSDVPEPVPSLPRPGGDDAERLARLASLGYLAAPPTPKKGVRLDPADGLPGFRAMEQADVLLSQGKAKDAVALLTPYAQKDDGNPRLHHALAKALAADGRLDPALREIDAAIVLAPREEFLRQTRAAILLQQGDVAKGKAELEGILAANPRAVDAALDLAKLALERKDFEETRRVLEAAHAAGARDPEQLALLGSLAQARGDARAASSWFEQALELRPDFPLALLETGRAALRQGQVDLAVTRFSGCTEGPKAFECRMELARAYLTGKGDAAQARRALESAQAAARNDSQREEARRRLQSLP